MLGSKQLTLKSMTALVTITLLGTPILTSLAPVSAEAASVNPPSSLLKKSASYYKQHKKALIKQYKLSPSSQNALNKKTGKVRIYVNTSDKYLKQSLTLAMSYWNKKLGKKEFTTGTKKSHDLTFSISKEKATKDDQSDAWWQPDGKKLQVRWSDYQSEEYNVGAEMTQKLNNDDEATITQQATAALTAKGITKSNTATATYNKLFTQEAATLAAQVRPELVKQVTDIQNNVAKEGRMFEYAGTLAHEMGHVMGLNHSPNAKDLMYYESGTNLIYDYAKVKAGLPGYNPVTSTDQHRAQLALKVFLATH